MLIALLAFASCNSDDEPTNLAENAVGTYDGYTNASCAYFSDMVAANQTVAITSAELNKVNISYRSDSWGTFTIDAAELSGSEGNIHISGTGKTMMSHAGNEAKEYDCAVEGTIAGNDLSLSIVCPAVMGGLSIAFHTGDVPSAE